MSTENDVRLPAQLADFIPAGAKVLLMGPERLDLQSELPFGCTSHSMQIGVDQDPRTHSKLSTASHIVLANADRWDNQLQDILPHIVECRPSVILHHEQPATETSNSHERLQGLFASVGYSIRNCYEVSPTERICVAKSAPIETPTPKKVLALSFYHMGNFGDRIGFHLLNEVVPPGAQVYHAHFQVKEQYRPVGYPNLDYDLLVLGIGNSLFEMTLTEHLSALIDRIPQRVGIFGTQYREILSRQKLQAVIEKLDVWFARYEEDTLLYGEYGKEVVHLGDWLINAFPLHPATLDRKLKIGKEIWNDLPLDRTIQQIQRYKEVFSTRVHPLLCSLTSAERVAYSEQLFEGKPSGKFRAMLLDVFGRSYPTETYFDVDRDAVARYKRQVRERTNKMTQRLAELLS